MRKGESGKRRKHKDKILFKRKRKHLPWLLLFNYKCQQHCRATVQDHHPYSTTTAPSVCWITALILKGSSSVGRGLMCFFYLCSFKKIFLNTQNTVYYITLYQHATQVFIKYKIIYEGQNVVAVSFHWPITLKYRMWLGLSFNHICVIITFNSWKLKAVSASSFQLCNIKDISDTHVCEPLIKTLGGALIRVFFLLPCDTDNLY